MRPKSPISGSPGLTWLLFYLSFILQTDLIYQWDSIVFLHVIRVSIINQVIIQLDKQSIQCSFFWSNDNDVSVRERKEVFCALASKTSYQLLSDIYFYKCVKNLLLNSRNVWALVSSSLEKCELMHSEATEYERKNLHLPFSLLEIWSWWFGNRLSLKPSRFKM